VVLRLGRGAKQNRGSSMKILEPATKLGERLIGGVAASSKITTLMSGEGDKLQGGCCWGLYIEEAWPKRVTQGFMLALSPIHDFRYDFQKGKNLGLVTI
jgi:hypothetical protein